MAQTFDVSVRTDIAFAEHDGVKLVGDLYSPKGAGEACRAGRGAWRRLADRRSQFYSHWGAYLAGNGYAVFAIEYRLMKPGVKTYPAPFTT